MRKKEIVLRKMLEDQGWRVFDIDEQGGCEIERWTDGGVDVILYIQPFTIEEYKDVINRIDCSEEVVLLWNNDPTYKQDFGTIGNAYEDYKSFKDEMIAGFEKFN